MRRKRLNLKGKLWLLLVLTALLTACQDAGAGDPVQVVEDYLQAKVDGDAAAIGALLCSEMEGVLEREVNTFASVSGAELQDMVCSAAETGRVTCTGSIVALYGTEETRFPLTSYRVVEEDGAWKWCGEG